MNLRTYHPVRRWRSSKAFTLVESLVACTLLGTVGAIIYTLANAGLLSFARNLSINKSYEDARSTLEWIALYVQSAGQMPTLLEADGDSVSGTGPAAGILVYRLLNSPTYTNQSAVSFDATYLTAIIATGQAVPRAGDLVLFTSLDTTRAQGFQAKISSVGTPSGNTVRLNFSNTVGSSSQPVVTSGTAIPANARFQIFSRVAIIAAGAQGKELRYYPFVRTVAADGQTAFDNPANYTVLANLVPPDRNNNASFCLPFSFPDANRSLLDVDLRCELPTYNRQSKGGLDPFNYFSPAQCSYAPRSPNLLRPIN